MKKIFLPLLMFLLLTLRVTAHAAQPYIGIATPGLSFVGTKATRICKILKTQ